MIIGIVGEAGVGKTTATTFFQKNNAYVIFADLIVKYIYTLDQTKAALIKEFGNCFISSNKTIDKRKLRQEAFHNPHILRKLETIIWPPMKKIIAAEVENHKLEALIVIDCVVLFNAELNSLVDKVILIEAEEQLKINRTRNRDNVNDLQIISLLGQQKKYLILNQDIDYTIKNNGSINDLIKQLQKLLKKIMPNK